MSDNITLETISRRKVLSVLGLALAVAVPTTTLTVLRGRGPDHGYDPCDRIGAQVATSGVMIVARVAPSGATLGGPAAHSSSWSWPQRLALGYSGLPKGGGEHPAGL